MSKRNDVANALLSAIRAQDGDRLGDLDNESEITRGPADPDIAGDMDLYLKHRRVLVDIETDEMVPVTFTKEGHEMVVGVLVLERQTKPDTSIENVVDLAHEVERAIYADRTLGGEVFDTYGRSLVTGYLAGDTDFLTFARLEVVCKYQSTN